MAEKRISELTAKGSTIDALDLVPISEWDGVSAYVSKTVTGAQLGGASSGISADANNILSLGTDSLPLLSQKEATSVEISFNQITLYNTVASAGTGNITNNLTDAKTMTVQKIYHNSGTAPTFPADWVKLGSANYTVSVLNIIFCEWISGTRVEYWIVKG